MDTPSQEPGQEMDGAGATALRKLYNLPADATEDQLREAQRSGRVEELEKLGLGPDATEEEVLKALARSEARAKTLEVLRKAEAKQNE